MSKNLNVKLKDEVFTTLTNCANKEECSISHIARRAIKEYIEKNEHNDKD